MPVVYLSYPWTETGGRMPPWMTSLISSFDQQLGKGVYHFYDPAQAFLSQLEAAKDQLDPIPSTPQVLMQMLGAPTQLYLNVCDDVRAWGEFEDYRHKTWCDLFFALRASLMIIDLNLPSRQGESLEFALAGLRGIPVLGISDRVVNPPQALYLTTMVMPSTSPHLAEVVYKLVPPPPKVPHGADSPEVASAPEGSVSRDQPRGSDVDVPDVSTNRDG